MEFIDNIGPYNVVHCVTALLELDVSLVQAKLDEKFSLDIAYLEELLENYQQRHRQRAYPDMTLYETHALLLKDLVHHAQHCVQQLAPEGQRQLLQHLEELWHAKTT